MRHVWVVSHGTQNEGGSPIAVFARKPSAAQVTALKTAPFLFRGNDWDWREESEGYWVSGCDYLQLERFKVR
jgi:hypothetical protein